MAQHQRRTHAFDVLQARKTGGGDLDAAETLASDAPSPGSRPFASNGLDGRAFPPHGRGRARPPWHQALAAAAMGRGRTLIDVFSARKLAVMRGIGADLAEDEITTVLNVMRAVTSRLKDLEGNGV